MDKGFTLWFTGLFGAGKTTVSEIVAEKLRNRGHKVEILDGDVIRTNLSKGLGFSQEDRDTNIRRIGFVCDLLSRNGVVAIAAAISPYEAIRRENREMINNYVEVFVDCDLDTLIERDVKGLYKKALAGEIKNFTGIDDPYEAPGDAEINIHSNNESVDESVDVVLRRLEELGFTNSQPDDGYSEDEEAKVAERLEALGYID